MTLSTGTSPKLINAEQVRQSLAWLPLIEALRQQFVEGCVMPVRHHHDIAVADQTNATLLLMPAWIEGRYLGVKQVSVFPDNSNHQLPTINGSYLLSCGKTGQLLAMIDAPALTVRRTAAAFVLAAGFLARPDSKHLLMVGTGALSANFIEAYAAAFELQQISLWGRDIDKAEQLSQRLRSQGLPVTAVEDLQQQCGQADIISCATLSKQPLINGQWLSPGTHVDLVGGFKPDMREADDTVINRADLYVDTRDGACKEAGDIVIPLQQGLISPDDIKADLYQLCRQQRQGRSNTEAITLFKSVGAALEDLAAAIMVYQHSS
ncbi:MAG: ornithine cyclodeaminase family protein [Motiliproteus sp.]